MRNPKEAETKPNQAERPIDSQGWEMENQILSQEPAERKEEESQGAIENSQPEADQKGEDTVYDWEPPSPSI